MKLQRNMPRDRIIRSIVLLKPTQGGMKMLHLCIAILVLALSGFAVSGCGGSSKTTSTVASASTPTTESTATTETTSSTPATPPPITGATVTLVHGKPL